MQIDLINKQQKQLKLVGGERAGLILNTEEELNECNQMLVDYFVLWNSLIVLLDEPNP